MAIDYTLHMNVEGGLVAFEAHLRADAGAVLKLVSDDGLKVVADGLHGGAFASGERSADIIQKLFSVRPTVGLLCRLNKFSLGTAQDSLATVVAFAIRAVAGDAVLLFNGEMPVFRRRGHTLLARRDFRPLTDRIHILEGVLKRPIENANFDD